MENCDNRARCRLSLAEIRTGNLQNMKHNYHTRYGRYYELPYFPFCGFISAVLATARTIEGSIMYFSSSLQRSHRWVPPNLYQWVKVKVKVKVTLERAMKGPERKQMYRSTLSLTSALDGVGGKRRAPAALTPGKTRYPLYRRPGGPQGRAGLVRKISPLPGFDSWTVQPVASRYTDCAIPATYPMGTEGKVVAVRTSAFTPTITKVNNAWSYTTTSTHVGAICYLGKLPSDVSMSPFIPNVVHTFSFLQCLPNVVHTFSFLQCLPNVVHTFSFLQCLSTFMFTPN
jgi:hypothetical protein